MWSGIIIITGMVLLALLVFVGIAVWYSIRKQELEVEKIKAKPVSEAGKIKCSSYVELEDEEDD